MKNIFLENLTDQNLEVEIEGESFHHFKNVTRGKEGEDVQLFNGKGLIASGVVSALTKKNLIVTVQAFHTFERATSPTLILGVPKKEYLESILRSAIQTGVATIKLVTTEFTPWKYKYYERLGKIMESTLIQCECAFLPLIEEYASLEDALNSSDDLKLVFSTEVKNEAKKGIQNIQTLLVGPEGGFSLEEIDFLKNRADTILMKCNIPIMKAEVAVPFGIGLLYAANNA